MSQASQWTPPKDFVPVPSQIEGIEIYAPAPKQDVEKTRTFKCRQCGGTISYSATQRQLTCPYCNSEQQIDAEAVGRRADEFEFTVETMEQARHGWGETRKELVCESCGSVVSVAKDVLTSTCAFCGSNRVLARDASGSDVLRPTSLIPFTIDKEHCQTQVRTWLGRGWMHPPELREVRALEGLIGVYLPYWTFDTQTNADWKAEVGTERTEHYRDHNGESKTRTVIDWHWRSGRVHVPIDDHLVSGTSKVSQIILGHIEPFNLSGLVEYDPGYLAGWQAKLYDVLLPKAWEIAKEEIRAITKHTCYKDTGSSHVRNMRMTVDFGDERWRYILLPIYLASYPFEESTFQIMVNGQTGKVAGQKPIAWLRVWLAIVGLLVPGACLGLGGLLLSIPLPPAGIIGLAIGFILLIAGLIGAAIIFRQARASEKV
jgi:Zn finger protein HypA/HybF involved in hydrogenase expression